ncbi:DapH/DapD/GlmU-related protein [Mariniflexile sp.]|uniref:acyltransferase n=1 Tax=Mariniflexile sp. TaxID=1979402 RepID=UPI003561ACC1
MKLTKIKLIPLLKVGRNFIVYKNAKVSLAKTSKITLNNVFQFNSKWTNNDPFPSLLAMSSDSSLIVKGNFKIFSGSRVYINEGASLILGSGYINNNLNLSCFEKIEIGNNVAISENVCIRDSDNHTILPTAHQKNQAVKIGDNVWIGMNVTILKGVTIGNGCVIAAGSVVNKSIPDKCLAGGVPAKILYENIVWE